MKEKTDIKFDDKFNDVAKGYIEYKRSLGFKVNIITQRNLKILLEFLYTENPSNPYEFTDDTVMKFCFQNTNIKPITIQRKQTLIRQFALYLNEIKGIRCYVYNGNQIKKDKDYLPHIYSVDEIYKIIETIDNMEYTSISIKRQIPKKISAIIRLIYGCGLRINEAATLKRSDVNLIDGTINIFGAKNNKVRCIPISKSLKESLIDYDKHLKRDFTNPYFFPQDDGYFSIESIRRLFKRAVIESGIDGRDSNGEIRIHCLRHTYCVHAMEKLINEGMDPYCTLPIISTYMGHSDLKSSEYYMRLTKHYFQEVLNYSKDDADRLFPEVKYDE